MNVAAGSSLDDVSVLTVSEVEGGTTGVLTCRRLPGLHVRLVISPRGELMELSVLAAHRSVRARDVRGLPVGALVRALRRARSERASGSSYQSPILRPLPARSQPAAAHAQEVRNWRQFTSAFLIEPRPGAGGRPDLPYAAIAACYVAAFSRGEPKPVAAVARELGLGETAVRNYLTKARERQLLTTAEPGRAGGSLTSKSTALLDNVP